MDSWLKQAEEESQIREQLSRTHQKRFRERRAKIRDNYAAYKNEYASLVSQFEEMVSRVNTLPFEKRSIFGKLRIRPKHTKLDNHLYIISGSRKIDKNQYFSWLPWMRKSRIKHIRVAYLSVSKQLHHFSLELKESMLEKRELKGEGRRKGRLRKPTQKRTDLVFTIPFVEWSDDRSYQVIDWMSFQKEMSKMDFMKFESRDISDRHNHTLTNDDQHTSTGTTDSAS